MTLRLDIGCGGRGSKWPGFIGIDVHPKPEQPTIKDAEYVRGDFVKDDLPWAAETVDEIVALHMIEHVGREDGCALVTRAFSLLRRGCMFSITTPDLRLLCCRYIAGDAGFWRQRHIRDEQLLAEVWPGRTLSDRLNWAIHQDGHHWAYDYEGLVALMGDAGVNVASEVRPIPMTSPYFKPARFECGVIVQKGGFDEA